MKNWIAYLIVLFLGVQACRQPSVPKQTEGPTQLERRTQMLFAADSCWKAMMKSDDYKLDNIKRLAYELNLIDGASPDLNQQVESEIARLKTSRYDRFSIGKAKTIDQYDSLTNRVLALVKGEIHRNQNAVKYQIVEQLMNEIQQADDSVLYYRKEYDRSLDRLAEFYKKNKKDLVKALGSPDSLTNYPYFRLIP